MNRHTRLLLIKVGIIVVPLALILLALRFVLPQWATEHRRSVLGDEYRKVEADLYDVMTVLPAEEVRPMLDMLEAFRRAFYAEYAEAFDIAPVEGRVHVVICENREVFERYTTEEFRQDYSNSDGVYSPGRKEIVIVDRHSREGNLRLILHEGIHMIFDLGVARSRTDWSYWFAEGVASYFEQSSPRPSGGFELGGVDRPLLVIALEALEAGRWLPLAELVEAGGGRFAGADNALYYAESTFLVHFLMEAEGGRYREGLFRFFERERRAEKPGVADLERAVGLSIEELDERVREHLRRLAEAELVGRPS